MWWSCTSVFFLLVAIATASNFKSENVDYHFTVTGRTLTGLHEVSDQYSGILYKAKLRIQPKSDTKWLAQLENAEMSNIHAHLHNGWETHIPDAELSWKSMGMSSKPFEVVLKSGIIDDLIVDGNIPNWEANMLKGIMSQFQLDTKASHQINSQINTPSNMKKLSAMFKTMEDTVTGSVETLYEIHPIPEYLQLNEHEFFNKQDQHHIFEVIRNKNYSNSYELPSYSFGLGHVKAWKPAVNIMGGFFIRNSYSRAILSGNFNQHLILNSYTVNTISVNPTISDQQRGQVVSFVNVTLTAQTPRREMIDDVTQPMPLGGLVYTYEAPNTNQNKVHRERSSMEDNRLEHPKLYEAPGSPLLPYSMGHGGVSIRKDVNVVDKAQKLAQEIGDDVNDPLRVLLVNTLNKFTILRNLCRVMSANEMQKAANLLYTDSASGLAAWQTFRDAVAHSGTGPALLTIQKWILSEKITPKESSRVIATMADAARQPSLEYLQTFFELIKSPAVTSQWPLNDTAILSFGFLSRKAVVHTQFSSKEYPSGSYRSFASDESKSFVERTVIPYYSEMLHEAIAQAETHKIHTFIRGIGNIAHPNCLITFKPYLEGTKQASQFQRLQMILAMDKLVLTQHSLAQSVLFRIFQNTEENQVVRIAAIYQLFKTNPKADMLQLIAQNTHVDKQVHVNEAVITAIQIHANLRGDQHEQIRSAARSALPFLSKNVHGTRNGGQMIRQYIYEQMAAKFTESVDIYGNQDSLLPKALSYYLGSNLNGWRKTLINFQAMISNVDDLIQVVEQQTSSFDDNTKQQKMNLDQQMKNQWSSQNIAKLLNIKADENEQLEGYLFMDYTDAPFKFLAFDNKTVEILPRFVQRLEDMYKNGKKYEYTQFSNEREMTVSFPTEMGFPFFFKYDNPVLRIVTGDVKAAAKPKISHDGKLHQPEKLNIKTNTCVTYTSKIQGRLSFFTPFDHQQYISGYDKHFQVHLPIESDIEIDVKNMQMKAEFNVEEPHQNSKWLHYSTWPYTSAEDFQNIRPLASQPNTQIIQQQNLRTFDRIFGSKNTGIAVRVQAHHEREFIDSKKMLNSIRRGHFLDAFSSLWNDGAIQYSHLNISLVPEQTTAKKVIVRLGYQQHYKPEPQSSDNEIDWSDYLAANDASQRQQVLFDKVSPGIKNVNVRVLDASVDFQGESNIEYSITGAMSKSNVDSKSRVAVYYKQNNNNQEETRPYGVSVVASNVIPNTNALDLDYSMKKEPKIQTAIDVHFGYKHEPLTRVQAQLKFRRSENRKNYLKEQPYYRQCQEEMRQSNKQLSACANITMESNLLDHFQGKIKYQNLSKELLQSIRNAYDLAKVQYFLTTEEKIVSERIESNEVIVDVKFAGDLRSFNASVQMDDKQQMLNEIPISDLTKTVMIPHPVFDLSNRLLARTFGLNTYKPVCVIDKTMASTFNGQVYPIEMRNYWTVMFQYVPKDARHNDGSRSVVEQLQQQMENYVMLVRETSQNMKEVKLTLSTPQTGSEVRDITLTPYYGDADRRANVKVDGQSVDISTKQSHDINGDYIQIYVLPNGEVKVEVKGKFSVIYDGERVQVASLSGVFKNSIRGLCGQQNDEPTEDFLTPQNCFTKDTRKFLSSFEVEGEEGRSTRNSFMGRSSDCFEKITPIYQNVIVQQSRTSERVTNGCDRYRKTSRYIEVDGKLCFTIEPVPECDHKCRNGQHRYQDISVHCVALSNVSQLWKVQVDAGASLDFSHKTVTKFIRMPVPESCNF